MFGNLLSKLKGGAESLVNSALSSNDTDVMEAMVAAGVLAAYADGDLSDDETKVVVGILGASKQLEVFGDEPIKLFDKYCDTMEVSKRTGKFTLMKEIADLKGDKDNSIRVLLMAIEVSDADNDIDADEMKVLRAIAKELSLELNDYI